MPVDVHDTQLLLDLVAAEHLDGDNGGVLHEVADDLSVEDLQGAVVAGVCEEGQSAVELYGADGLWVEAHGLVGAVGQVEVVPEQAAVVGADDEVVAARVDVHGGDPAGAGLDDLDELLALQVVAADHALGGDEEVGARRVELGCLGEAGELAEGDLAEVLGERVDDDGAALAGGGDGAEEVAAAVPVDGLDGGADGELEQHALCDEGRAGARPLGWGFLLGAVGGGCSGGGGGAVGCVAEAGVEDVPAGLLGGIADDGRGDEEEVLARGGGQDEGVLAGPPSHHIDGLRLVGRAELGAPFLVAVERPDADGAVVAAGGDPLAVRAEGDGAHAARVALEDGLAHGRERPQLLGARQLGQQRAGVDVEPVLAHPRRKVEVEAALEPLLDELAVRGHLAQGIKLARKILLLPLLRVELLPVVLLLRCG